MPKKRKPSIRTRIHQQKSKKEQPSILQEEEEDKKWSWSWILTCVLLIYVCMSFMHGCFAIIDLKEQDNVVVKQIREEEAAQKGLENEVSYLQTEEAVEKIAREDLKMVKPGEILLTRRDHKEKEQPSQEVEQNEKSADQATTDEEKSEPEKTTEE